MSVSITIPDPLATEVEAAAKSHATSLEQYVIDAVAKTVASELPSPAGDEHDPVLGSFGDDHELIDSIVEAAMLRRRTAPARTCGE
ncbi:MAG: hypothetical protein ACRCT8_17920 [Lacipirellulaceae bacterium]